jgi:hypothetical protein
MRQIIFAVWAAILFAGCAAATKATGPTFSPIQAHKGNEGVIYVYRLPDSTYSSTDPQIAIDGEVMSSLKMGGYLAFCAEEGPHIIQEKMSVLNLSMTDRDSVRIDVKPGESRFISVSVHTSPQISPRGTVNAPSGTVVFYFQEVDEDTGRKEISILRLSQ